ncbi:MAG: type II toxin-antitoxin system VapC family toxin [Magnetococcales bacterium]|nr:type II toxin-antitoxin system VapC family toxin [Magnetococcales bacterium]
MNPKVYLETSIISYLAARPSRDLVLAAHQQITAEWWDKSRRHFDLYTSELIFREANAGDPGAAKRRLEFLAGLPSLNVNEEVMTLAIALLDARAVPRQAVDDAYHIALAAVHRMDYLLTWNCKHIANATMWSRIDGICRSQGHEPPAIATPEQLQEE